MVLVLEIIIPIFGFIGLGYLMARTPLLSAEGTKGLSQFVFFCAIPALLFRAGVRLFAEGAEPVEPGLLIAFFGGGLGIQLSVLLWLWFVRKRPLAEATMAGLCAAFTNTVMLGLPLSFALFGDRGLLLTSSVIAVNGLVYYTLTTTLIELGQGSGGSPIRNVVSGLAALVKNPILLGMVIGLAWGFAGIPIPGPAAKMIDLLAAAAPPVALFALGASLVQFRLAGDLVEAVWITAIKLLVSPALVGAIGYYLIGLRGDTLALAIILASTPVGVNPFLIATRYGVYVQRCGSAVLITTALSVISISVLIALLAPGGNPP